MAASTSARWWLDPAQAVGVLAAEKRQGELADAVPGGGPLAQERGAGELELVEPGVDGRLRRLRPRVDHRRHAGDEPRIDAVGLGLGADRLGEAPDPGGVELRGGEAGAVERALEGGVVGAGRLEGDEADAVRGADPAEERPVSGGIVGDATGLAVRPAAGVEMIFRDVDADGRCRSSFPVPHACHASLALGFPFGSREGRGAIQLSNGPIGSAVMRRARRPTGPCRSPTASGRRAASR